MARIKELKVGDWVVPADEDIICAQIKSITPIGEIPGKADAYQIDLCNIVRKPNRGYIIRSPFQMEKMIPGEKYAIVPGVSITMDQLLTDQIV